MGKDQGKKSYWTNPHQKLNLQLSHAPYKQHMNRADVLNIYSSGAKVTYWGGSVPQWFSIDLGMPLLPTYYSLRHGYNAANSFPNDISLEGSNDNHNWVILDKQSGSSFTLAFEARSFPVRQQYTSYRYYRVLQPGFYGMGTYVNETGSHFFCVSGFELYGTLYPGGIPDDEDSKGYFSEPELSDEEQIEQQQQENNNKEPEKQTRKKKTPKKRKSNDRRKSN